MRELCLTSSAQSASASRSSSLTAGRPAGLLTYTCASGSGQSGEKLHAARRAGVSAARTPGSAHALTQIEHWQQQEHMPLCALITRATQCRQDRKGISANESSESRVKRTYANVNAAQDRT
jgi:hypothetical protein